MKKKYIRTYGLTVQGTEATSDWDSRDSCKKIKMKKKIFKFGLKYGQTNVRTDKPMDGRTDNLRHPLIEIWKKTNNFFCFWSDFENEAKRLECIHSFRAKEKITFEKFFNFHLRDNAYSFSVLFFGAICVSRIQKGKWFPKLKNALSLSEGESMRRDASNAIRFGIR